MANDTIFFSYSRDDSSFVLQLAKDLRGAGATIWLDTLDIQPGTHWDSSIEKALKESSTLLVILSNTSVKSNNVMDEVSYALEENKKVVPILLENCAIPFRLKRLQYADFTENRETGLKNLVDALKLEKEVANKLVPHATQYEATTKQQETNRGEYNDRPQQDQPNRTEYNQQNSQQQQRPQNFQQNINPQRPVSKSNNTPYFILGGCLFIVVFIIIIILIIAYTGGCEPEYYDNGY